MANSSSGSLFSLQWLSIAFVLGLILQILGWIVASDS
jgi:hypothetical protein